MKRVFIILLAAILCAGWRAGSQPNFFFYDGSSTPTAAVPQGLFASDTNMTWLCWEGYQPVSNTPKRVVECATYNVVSGVWTENYIAGTQTLSNDLHGVPSVVRDSTHKHVYIFYAAHNSDTQISYTTNPDDPSAWTTSSLASATYGTMTFPTAFIDGSTLYLMYCRGTGSGGDLQSKLSVTSATINANGSLTWSGTFKDLFDFGDGAWLLEDWTAIRAASGTGIAALFSYNATYPTQPLTGQYIGIYDPATGNVKSANGSTIIAPASQPINITTANASFKVASTTGTAGLMAIDAKGTIHLVYGDQSANPETLKYINNSAGSWSAPLTIFTYPAAVTTQVFGNPVLNGSGGIDVFYTDGAGDGSGQYAASNGNVWKRTRDSDGTWQAAQLILGSQNYTLVDPVQIRSFGTDGSAAVRIIFAETSTDGIAIAGNLRGYAYGDNGFLHRPWPWSVLNPQ